MGASKGVLLSGIALIVGMYAVGIKKADAIIAGSAGTRVYQIQSDANARTGIRLALNDMRDNNSWSTRSKTIIFLADTIQYDIDNIQSSSPKKAKITSTSRFKGVETKVIAYVEEGAPILNKKGKRIGYDWTITRTYLIPSNE
ncbi:MAG: hypothetical protein HYY49_02030 [Ignavibacteriales bacterium]|nr:hypothetical protein [Ignavibacteriales bacterium]